MKPKDLDLVASMTSQTSMPTTIFGMSRVWKVGLPGQVVDSWHEEK
jgi:hypothetical protein